MQKNMFEKIEYNRALKRLDITPHPFKRRNPFKKKVDTFLTVSQKKQISEENDFDLLIDALFFYAKNEYCLEKIESSLPFDYFNTKIKFTSLKALKISDLKLEEIEEIKSSPIETFWYNEVSKENTVRWDVFEEAIISYFLLHINMIISFVRKIN